MRPQLPRRAQCKASAGTMSARFRVHGGPETYAGSADAVVCRRTKADE